ncbi:hypothetical protein FRC18_002675 [Serendipita sp. 400]|nr:hypothetical protein FRC18_002675 [Serendipita sp. 400]
MNFYKSCADILQRLSDKKGSIKSLVGSLPEKDRKRAAALVIETLKYQPLLLSVIEASGILRDEKKLLRDRNLVLVLVHDLLLSKGGIQMGDGPVKQAVLKHKTRLNAEFVKEKVKHGVSRTEDLAKSSVPNDTDESQGGNLRRWVRINTLRTTEKEVMGILSSQGFKYVEADSQEDPRSFQKDVHVPNLLSFSPTTQFQDSALLKDGKIILQDKASCFPAFVLNPPADSRFHVIDATAAPGNKTSHLSAIMKGKGRVTAFERDKKRFQTLKSMLDRAGASNVVPRNQDFLSVDPLDSEYQSVTHILLDPSCSGSGIVDRLDYLVNSENDTNTAEIEERLKKLASFQLKMIRHAMKFPSLQRLVYSTCSLHTTENEEVVVQALQSEEALEGNFKIESRAKVIPAWPRRGLRLEQMDESVPSESLVRCLPEDGTNGFFVACFVRVNGKQPSDHKRKAGELGSDSEAPNDEAGNGKNMVNSIEDGTAKPRKRKKRKKKHATGVVAT